MTAPHLLLLTVGVGSAGKYANLAAGLLTTARLHQPDHCLLLPSSHPDSLAIADLLREELPAFLSWSDEDPYPVVRNPDDLEAVRSHFLDVIASLKERFPDASFSINPTSGTKSMTAAACLAALQQDITQIAFTSGERHEGTVKTGSEQLVRFNPAAYLHQQQLQQARSLASSGAFFPAADLLRHNPLPESSPLRARLLCLHHWHRLHFAQALNVLGEHHPQTHARLARRLQAHKSGSFSPEILADLLAWADHALHLNQPEEAVRLLYQALEYAAQSAFTQTTGFPYPPTEEQFLQLPLSPTFRHSLASLRPTPLSEGPRILLGLHKLCLLLKDLQHPLGTAFLHNKDLQQALRLRNASTHALQPVPLAEAKAFRQHLIPCLQQAFPNLPTTRLPITDFLQIP